MAKSAFVLSGLLGPFFMLVYRIYIGLLDVSWSKIYYITVPSGNTESHVAKDFKAGGRQGDTWGSPHDTRTEPSGQ